MNRSLQFVRTDHCDGAIETLSLVRAVQDGSLYVQVQSGSPRDLGDYVGLYTLAGDRVSGTVGPFDLVPGDRLHDGAEARLVASELASAAPRSASPVQYLCEDGSLLFASIFCGWESSHQTVMGWVEV